VADDPAHRYISRLRLGGFHGLAARYRTPDIEDADALLVRYAPQLVVLPEDIDRTHAPGPRTDHDYHPRSARMFADIARTVPFGIDAGIDEPAPAVGVATPGGRGRNAPPIWRLSARTGRPLDLLDLARPLALVFLAVMAAAAVLRRAPRALVGGILGAGALLALAVHADAEMRLALPRIGGKAVQRRLDSAWPGRLRHERLTLPGGVGTGSVWRLYARLVRTRADRYPRTVYGRTVQAGDVMAVQYWLFFFYNAWHNLHEADWELITVLHDPRSDGPASVSASAHASGTRLPPREVTWIDGQPVVYVAAGSHALYFRPGRPAARRPLALRGRGRVASQRLRLGAGSSRDWVAAVDPQRCVELPSATYELRRLPDVAQLEPGVDGWPAWWWLAYGGGWGRVRPIPGPAFQGPRWDDPLGWASSLPANQPATESARSVF